MTEGAVGFGRGFPRIWLIPIGALTLLLGIAATGRLSRSIAADFLAWWPVWLGLGLAAYFLRDRKFGQFRAAGIVPIVALVAILLFTWGHFAGWALMPSASQRLVGPVGEGFSSASLQAEIDGMLEVSGSSEYLYHVEPIRRGGTIGIPTATEQVLDTTAAVVLEPPANPGIYSYAGWDLMLSDSPTWSLMLAGAIDADLSSLTITDLDLGGAGTVVLGAVEDETAVSVAGDFRIVVPEDAPARVVGVASVPATWTTDTGGAASPVLGTGWVITVEPGATLTVAHQP
jgi:hypothetical protein